VLPVNSSRDRIAWVLSVLLALLAAAESGEVRAQQTPDSEHEPIFNVEYLNTHAEEFHDRQVAVTGYFRAGFDGYHFVCYLAASRTADEIHRLIWVDSESCAALANQQRLRQGKATVRGIFKNEERPSFIVPSFYKTSLSWAVIEWNK
jgi:hypothetical protein